MTSGLNGLEVSVGMVVRFWCVPLALFVRGYVAHVGAEGELSQVICLEPLYRRGEKYWVWAADCEVLKGTDGRPLRFVEGQEVEDDAEEVRSEGDAA